jgi:MFS family permease
MLPFGVAALAIANITPEAVRTRRRHRIDYGGGALLVAWVTALVLVTRLGGTTFPWRSWQIAALLFACGASLGWFVRCERRAPEAMIPARLFRERVFVTAAMSQLLVGFVLIGVTIMAPLYLQFVLEVNATRSGLLTMPIVLGMLTSSVSTGRLITRTGRYRHFPIIGTAVMIASLVLLSSMDTTTGRVEAIVYMFLFGLGIGSTTQVVLLAVQNKVPHADLGIATSATSFFRSLGQTIGSAVFSAVLIARLDHFLPRLVPGSSVDVDSLQADPASIAALGPEAQAGIAESFARSLHDVFLFAVPIAVVAFLAVWLVPEHPLRERRAIDEQGPQAAEAVA